jgi:FixJ family two-component response regulator
MIFITAHDDAQVRTQAMKAGAIEVLFKPFDNDVLLKKVRSALQVNPRAARE